MAYVPVPKDLSKIKTKLAFNLTKRQLVCFSSGRPSRSYIARKKNGSMRPIIRNMAALFPILPRENR